MSDQPKRDDNSPNAEGKADHGWSGPSFMVAALGLFLTSLTLSVGAIFYFIKDTEDRKNKFENTFSSRLSTIEANLNQLVGTNYRIVQRHIEFGVSGLQTDKCKSMRGTPGPYVNDAEGTLRCSVTIFDKLDDKNQIIGYIMGNATKQDGSDFAVIDPTGFSENTIHFMVRWNGPNRSWSHSGHVFFVYRPITK